MTSTDPRQFAEIIAALAVAFGKQPDETLISAYKMFLQDVHIDDLRSGAMRAAQTLRFMPTVAELRELSGVASAKPRGVVAWGLVSKAAADIGSYRSVFFTDPIVNATIRSMGGWPALLERTSGDFDKWARMEFLKTYELLDETASPEMCRPLGSLSTRDENPVRVECEYVTANQRLLRLSSQSELAIVQTVSARTGQVSRLHHEPLLLRDVRTDETTGGYSGASPNIRKTGT